MLNIINTISRCLSLNLEEFKVIELCREGKFLDVLILTILSQNTNDELAYRAYMNLVREVEELIPEKILSLGFEKLKDLIKVSGLYERKARTIIELCKKFRSLDFENIEELKKQLISIKGLGEKSIDVFLLFCMNYLTFPIDTNIRRLLVRLGIIDEKMSYNQAKEMVMRMLPRNVELYKKAHLLLLMFGKIYCKALRPKCDLCPLKKVCRSGK